MKNMTMGWLVERGMIKRWSWSLEPFLCSQEPERDRESERRETVKTKSIPKKPGVLFYVFRSLNRRNITQQILSGERKRAMSAPPNEKELKGEQTQEYGKSDPEKYDLPAYPLCQPFLLAEKHVYFCWLLTRQHTQLKLVKVY